MKALIIEDDPGMRSLMRAVMKQDDVKFAERLDEALDMIAHEPGGFEIIIADLYLPDSQPPDTIAHLRLADRNAALIGMSGRESVPMVATMCDAFFPKTLLGPNPRATFAEVLERVKKQDTHERVAAQIEASLSLLPDEPDLQLNQ